jgi:ribonuclease VapC
MTIKDPEVHAMARELAGLNLGDCFSYGLARALDAPLLFKDTDSTGSDFSATDVLAALAS